MNWPNTYLLFFNLFWIYILLTAPKTPLPLLILFMILILNLLFSVPLTSVDCSPMSHSLKISIPALKLYITVTQLFPAFPHRHFVNICTLLPNLWNSALITLFTSIVMLLPWKVPLALLWQIFLWNFINICFKKNFSKPLLYFRYIANTFAIFNNERECDQFLQKFNTSWLHPFLVFIQ